MASPQDSPTRKKQKARARRKLAKWREKQASAPAQPDAAAKTPAAKGAVKAAAKAPAAKTAAAKSPAAKAPAAKK